MSWQSWFLAIFIVLLGGAQYGLMTYALRDLRRRPRVRWNNKVAWALLILTLPFVGALVYSSIGPTSFLPRAVRPARRPVVLRTGTAPGDEAKRDPPSTDAA
jgi:hypothetical protein